MDIWVNVVGYEESYLVNRRGDIRVIKTGKQKKQRIDRYGYPCLLLSKNAIKKHFCIHRIVALTFIPNPYNLPTINHINGIKTDNRVENLEWTTVQQNIRHAVATGLRPSQKGKSKPGCSQPGTRHPQATPVIQFTMDGKFVRRYEFIQQAKKFGFQPTHIGSCAKGKVRHHRNFKWEYA